MALSKQIQGSQLFLYFISLIPAYAAGLWYGYRHKHFFYLAALPFSGIVLVTAFLLDKSTDFAMLLLIFLFVIASVTALVWWLIRIQKQLAHETRL